MIPSCSLGTDKLACDFEGTGNLCSWQINSPVAPAFTWKHYRAGAAFTAGQGPVFDHTTHSMAGHYVVARSSTANTYVGSKSRLESTLIADDLKRCLQFYYRSYHAAGTLNVLTNSRQFPVTVFNCSYYFSFYFLFSTISFIYFIFLFIL